MRKLWMPGRSAIVDLGAAGFCLIFALGMISPTLEVSRERVHRAKCVCNLKRLWAAFSSYVQEHEGRLPAVGLCDRNLAEDWTWGGNIVPVPQTVDSVERIEIEKGAIWPYLYGTSQPQDTSWYGDARKNAYLCPTAGAVGRKRGSSYSMNMQLDFSPGYFPVFGTVLASVASPEKTFLLVEENELTINDGTFIRTGHESQIDQSEVHDGGANHLLCDGHIERLPRVELERRMESGEGFEWEEK